MVVWPGVYVSAPRAKSVTNWRGGPRSSLTYLRSQFPAPAFAYFRLLNAQQTLLQARVQLVSAQHDQVVNSYNLFAAIGRLSITRLGLSVPEYDPRVHFDQVKHKWIGLRTPDGK